MKLESSPDHPCWPEPTWRRLVLAALVLRLAVIGLGLVWAPREPFVGWQDDWLKFRDSLRVGPFAWLEPWHRWDAFFYHDVSRFGYGPAEGAEKRRAFLPALPMAMAAGAAIGFDRVLMGVLVPYIAGIVGMTVTGRYAWAIFGRRDIVWKGLIILNLYPFSFFYSAPYQESIYLCAAATIAMAWVKQRPVMGGIFGIVASLSRLCSVAFIVGIALEWRRDHLRFHRLRTDFAIISGLLLGLLGFAIHLWTFTGDFLAHPHAHRLWGRQSPGFGPLWKSLSEGATSFLQPVTPHDVMAPIVVIGVVFLGIRGWIKRGPLWGCIMIIPLLQAMASGSLISLERIALCSFPAAFELADVVRRRMTFVLISLIFAMLQCVLCRAYIHYYFVG